MKPEILDNNLMNFTIDKIPDTIIKNMVDKSIWKKECPIAISDLSLLEVRHYNFSNQILNGQLIVLGSLAEDVINIFKELFILKFPIHSIKLINEFDGDDELSMAANNSSCFNFRTILGTDLLSMHSYGAAIDINPLQNPYIIQPPSDNIFPKNGLEFLDRNNIRAGMVEPIVEIFNKYGFTEWGGNWRTPIDYHHFQIPRNKI